MRNFFKLLTLVWILTGVDASAAIDFSPMRKIVSCGPNTVYFVYNNEVQPDLIYWDFGDGTGSTDVNPSHFYQDNGIYRVKLVVIRNNMRDSVVKDSFVTINPAPVAQMEISKASDVHDNKFLFTSSSIHNADSFVSQVWIVSDDTLRGDTVVYQFHADGEYTIRLVVTNNKGCSAESSTTVKIKDNDIDPVGLSETLLNSTALYPNPATTHMDVSLPGYAQHAAVVIVDITGRHYQPQVHRETDKITIDTSSLPPGAYQLLLSAGQEKAAKRFVIAQ
jgi:PKD repeat protein